LFAGLFGRDPRYYASLSPGAGLTSPPPAAYGSVDLGFGNRQVDSKLSICQLGIVQFPIHDWDSIGDLDDQQLLFRHLKECGDDPVDVLFFVIL